MKKILIFQIIKKSNGKVIILFIFYLLLKLTALYLQRTSSKLNIAAGLTKKIIQNFNF